MCKDIKTKYGCGHSTTTSHPCEKAKEPSGFWDSCFTKKPKYCSHPREEKKQFEGLCDKCRAGAASKTGRQDRSDSKPRKPLGRSASVREPAPAHNENIRLVNGTATGRHEFLQERAPSRGRSVTRGKHGPSVINVPHDKAAVPPPRGSITNYNNKPLPSLPPNSSRTSKIGRSSASTSRSSSRNGRPLVPPPRHGPYIPDNATSAVPAPLRPRRPSQSREREQKKDAPHPAPLPSYPPPESQARPPRGYKNYPPTASRHIEIAAPVPRRKLSKTFNEAADSFFGGGGRSRSASKTRERSLSRSRANKHDKHDNHHDKKHQKQPSAASSVIKKIKAGLGYDEYDESDSDEWVCADSRAIERGESTLPSTTTSRRASYHAGDYYMHGPRQV